jgi:hypothetical protein
MEHVNKFEISFINIIYSKKLNYNNYYSIIYK